MDDSSREETGRLRVLLSAYACQPGSGSEPGVGWNLATRLARFDDVTVLRGDLSESLEGRAAVDEWIRRHGSVPGLTIVHVETPRLAHWLERAHRLPGLHFLYYAAYRLWQRAAFVHARRLHANTQFDLVHHLTMIGYREPGFLFRLGPPFLWGPIGGASSEPWSFIASFGARAGIGLAARRVANWLEMRLAPRPRAAAQAASVLWAATTEDQRMASRHWNRAARLLSETGTDQSIARAAMVRQPGEPLVLAWSGLHIARKCLPVALEALAILGQDAGVRLRVLGGGPETARWKRHAASIGVAPAVSWQGQLPHEAALDAMRAAHAFVFTSVKEATSTVALEALSLGLPLVCHDACGMGSVVDETCGIKVPLRSPRESAAGFAEAMRRLRDEAGLVERLSAGALARARELTWNRKAEELSAAYREAVEAGR